MRGDADRHQRVCAGVVMIETRAPARRICRPPDRARARSSARRRIRPGGVVDHRTASPSSASLFDRRQDARGAVEKSRKLGERDRPLVVEVARRMPFPQELCDRRELRIRRRERAQIDFLSGPARPHRRQRRDDVRHRDKRRPAGWRAGLPCCARGTGDRESPTVRGRRRPRPAAGRCRRRVDLEQDLAIHQQGEEFEPGKTVLPPQLFDLLRRGEPGQRGRDLRIADLEQGAGARRFQHHLVAAPSHIREPRQDERVGIAELRRLRPIIGNLRFDDDLVLASCRAPRRYSNRPCRAKRRTRRSISFSISPPPDANAASGRPLRNICARSAALRAERSEADRKALEAGGDFSVCVNLECDVAVEPCGEAWPHGPPSLFYSGRGARPG